MDSRVDTHPGQAVYSPLVLSLYDWWVLKVSCSGIWKCSARHLLAHYNKHVGAVHLDVGVGTGYFLDHATFPVKRPEITLFDLNPNSLSYCAQRIARYQPGIVQGDALEPNTLPRCHFESIGLNFLLHCLPDGGRGKWRIFDHMIPSLSRTGTLFGSTILGAPRPAGFVPQWLMGVYNRKGRFSNASDSLDVLQAELNDRFETVELEQRGIVALFAVRTPRYLPR